MKKMKIIYWVSTALIILMIGFGSFADIFMVDAVRESIVRVGFPVNFLPFFGIAKLLAVVVILLPAVKWLKLSAYVGLFWYFLGAMYAHFAVGDPIEVSIGAIVAFVLVLISYFSWRKMEAQLASS